jgi:hypothetical protein
LSSTGERADHVQGGGGSYSGREKGRKSFVVKILTPKPFALKILQGIFAKPASVAASGRVGEGGTPENARFPKNELAEMAASATRNQNFFQQ